MLPLGRVWLFSFRKLTDRPLSREEAELQSLKEKLKRHMENASNPELITAKPKSPTLHGRLLAVCAAMPCLQALPLRLRAQARANRGRAPPANQPGMCPPAPPLISPCEQEGG